MSKTIPPHTKCRNCGQCCGIIPASSAEVAAIRKFIAAHPGVLDAVGAPGIDCPFRDSEKARCLIYPVRPLICRLMGVVSGMRCPHGNTRNLDGGKFLRGRPVDDAQVLNFIDWKEAMA